jgi:acyl-CoA synthetase (NDP forming)
VSAAGVPLLEGTATGLAALRHLFELRDAGAARAPAVPQPGVGAEVRARWAGRLARARAPLPEVEALALLGDYGVPAVRAEAAGSVEQVLAAAGRIGWPVALKTAAPGIAHKSDVGGVELGLAGPAALLAAYERLAARHGRRVLVARMVPAGVELALGGVHDPAFGPLLVLAFGGVLVEVVRDRHCAFPPLDHARALALLDRLAARPLLDGVRGAPPADIRAVADAVVRFSVLVADLGEHLHEVDVNPLIAGAGGCVAVDALVVPR